MLMRHALAILGVCLLSGCADPLVNKDPTKALPLPVEITKVGKESGARVGWMRLDEFGLLWFRPEEEGDGGDLPAFGFSSLTEGLLAKLSTPISRFGLD